MKEHNLYKLTVEILLAAVLIFLLLSCVSFDIGDPPSGFVRPANSPAENWCGPAGAFIAYYLMYYTGPGIIIALAAGIWALFCNMAGYKVDQLLLRTVGLVLVTASASATYYLLWPGEMFFPYADGLFPSGTGGILGIAIGDYLSGRFAELGTAVILSAAWFVGAILLADKVVIAALKYIGTAVWKTVTFLVPALEAAKEKAPSVSAIWKKLSRKQKDADREKPVKGDKDSQSRGAALLKKRKQKGRKLRDQGELFDEPEDSHDQQIEQHLEQQQDDVQAKPKKKKKRKIFSAKEKNQAANKGGKGKVKAPAGAAEPVSARPAPKKQEYVPKSYEDYTFPPLELLAEPEYGFGAIQEKMVGEKARALEELLEEFGIDAEVVNAEPGPAITMYELSLAAGIKVSQITNLSNDMARALGAGAVRVVAPLPGKHTIGIEVPNSQRETVRIKELITNSYDRVGKLQIPLYLGKSASGEALLSDLASMPHLLIAGTTGSGKSVCINSIITSVLMARRPDEVKMILIDPKMVEMAQFEMLPHLMCPVVTDTRRAEQILEWAATKMDERYELLAEAKVRNIASFNKLSTEEIIERFQPSTPDEEAKIPKKLPYIVIIIDELADLMMTSGKEVESYIVRIAQKSRAVGIHLIVATQRPQATVVTGLIKSNMPARIAFRVAARMDSRIILDQNGGETLLGQGDMLFLKPGTSDLVRAQGAFVDDDETRHVVKYIKDVAQPQFHPELMQLNQIDLSAGAQDDLFDDAVRIVLETKRGSVSLLQRRLSIGYARASRIIEMMAASGILGEYKGSQAREVTMTVDEWENLKANEARDMAAGYADLNDQPEEQAGQDVPAGQIENIQQDDSEDMDQDQDYQDDEEDEDYEQDDEQEEYEDDDEEEYEEDDDQEYDQDEPDQDEYEYEQHEEEKHAG